MKMKKDVVVAKVSIEDLDRLEDLLKQVDEKIPILIRHFEDMTKAAVKMSMAAKDLKRASDRLERAQHRS